MKFVQSEMTRNYDFSLVTEMTLNESLLFSDVNLNVTLTGHRHMIAHSHGTRYLHSGPTQTLRTSVQFVRNDNNLLIKRQRGRDDNYDRLWNLSDRPGRR